jgi:putative cardiolipin synthase
MTAEWQKAEQSPDGALMLGKRFSERLRDDDVRLTWAAADVVVDAPEKTQRDAEENSSMPLRRLEALLRAAKSEFIAVSPYFVPQEEGVNYLRDLVARGIRVRVVTNSLASTDVVAVHTGYRRYREDVVAAGVELYEMKPIGGDRPRPRLLGTSAPASASLLAKAYVVDR